jgi:type IV pilus assembly protein PilV
MGADSMKSLARRSSFGALRGISLIEVMVSIVVMTFGVIGLVGLQARAVQYSVSAEDTNRAALLANDIVTQMWLANSVNLSAGVVTNWQTKVASTSGLPNAVGNVVVNGNQATVTVRWRAPQAANASSYVTDVVIR